MDIEKILISIREEAAQLEKKKPKAPLRKHKDIDLIKTHFSSGRGSIIKRLESKTIRIARLTYKVPILGKVAKILFSFCKFHIKLPQFMIDYNVSKERISFLESEIVRLQKALKSSHRVSNNEFPDMSTSNLSQQKPHQGGHSVTN